MFGGPVGISLTRFSLRPGGAPNLFGKDPDCVVRPLGNFLICPFHQSKKTKGGQTGTLNPEDLG